MGLAEEIVDNWNSTARGYATEIITLKETGYNAWTIKTKTGYGVAIPVYKLSEISESFTSVRLYSDELLLEEKEKQPVLLLMTSNGSVQVPFSNLCSEFVTPGPDGEFRNKIIDEPAQWWSVWKELLGNRNIDERVYDALGELVSLLYLVKVGKEPVWNGPLGKTYDIDCGDEFYEIKSTTMRKKREITLSNQYQLDPPAGKVLKLIYCQFESALEGISINSVVEELDSLGYSSVIINEYLAALGLEKGRSARKRCYIIHGMTEYIVDDTFPRITDQSFIGGKKPVGVLNYTYTVTLDAISGKNILECEGFSHEV